jgi:hypothetical protein
MIGLLIAPIFYIAYLLWHSYWTGYLPVNWVLSQLQEMLLPMAVLILIYFISWLLIAVVISRFAMKHVIHLNMRLDRIKQREINTSEDFSATYLDTNNENLPPSQNDSLFLLPESYAQSPRGLADSLEHAFLPTSFVIGLGGLVFYFFERFFPPDPIVTTSIGPFLSLAMRIILFLPPVIVLLVIPVWLFRSSRIRVWNKKSGHTQYLGGTVMNLIYFIAGVGTIVQLGSGLFDLILLATVWGPFGPGGPLFFTFKFLFYRLVIISIPIPTFLVTVFYIRFSFSKHLTQMEGFLIPKK